MPHTTARLRLIPHLPADLLALIDGEVSSYRFPASKQRSCCVSRT